MNSTIFALCLTLAGPGAAEQTVGPQYQAAKAASMKDGRPLVVFVGQPVREVPDARAIEVPSFPEANAQAVVVGVVCDDKMYRKDLGAKATAGEVQSAIAGMTKPKVPDALAEVNAARAARGLPPYIHDPHLTLAAARVAESRAAGLIAGHTSNDFAALPPGAVATASGCAAWEPGMGWGSCCTYDRYTYAGAAFKLGRDGLRYMQLFVR